MKKIFFIASIFALFFFISCENDVNDFDNSSEERVSQVLSLKGDGQRLAYSTLNSTEKLKVWRTHFQEMKKNNNYSQIQIQFINEMSNLLKEDYFDKYNHELDNILIEIKLKGFKIFKPRQLFDLIASLDSTMKTDGGGVPPLMGDCTCNTVNDWCVWTTNCTGTAFCEYDTWGCGDLWRYPCNGVCQ